jgi:hypothetical protein
MSESGGRDTRVQVPRLPTPLARQFVRYMVGFGVAVAIGLAPFLGELDLPLFTPLLHLIPRSVRDTLVPLSAALMGLVAVVVQWLGQERLSRARQRKMFARTLAVVVFSFVLLFALNNFIVVRVPIPALGSTETFIVGFTRPDTPECQGFSDAECIKRLSMNEELIATYWGDRRIALASLCLKLAYLLFTGSFGALVGLLVLREQWKK